MQNHRTESELNEFVDAMEKTIVPRAVFALAAFGLIAAIYACNQAYGAHVAIAATLGLIPFLLAVTGFVWARNQKPKGDPT